MRLPRVEDVERLLPSPEDFTSRARSTGLTARVGVALGLAFAVCFLTGVWSHLQQDPQPWAPIGPDPVWLYRVTQGVHVTAGVAAVPLLLVKLWSVYPRLYLRPPRPGSGLVLHLLERGSIAVLVAAGIFQLVSGSLNIVQWYPWAFSFRATHEAVAWVAIGALLVHVAVKLPQTRDALRRPLDDESADAGAPVVGRRAVLAATGASSVLAVVLTAGQSVPLLGRVSVFGVRDGDGPQGLPVNRTARAAGVTATATAADFVLRVRHGDRVAAFTRADLEALPQQTHRLPIACVEGWSREATWTGVPVRDLVAAVGAPADVAVGVTSLQTKGAFGASELPAEFVADVRTLLALRLDGEPLSLDHGYPCRIIAPNRPGVRQTKWVSELEVRT